MLKHKGITLFTLLLIVAALPVLAIDISQASRTVEQNFDGMWDDGNNAPTQSMPADWLIDRQMNAPRTVGTWTNAQSEVMYTGGVSLASNAKNGTWNFGADGNSDRAVGGLSTTVASGTRCLSIMTHLSNIDAEAVSKLDLSYDIEKYRYGSNPEGFAVQLYYSTDGTNWTSAGDDFYTYFSPDASTIGAEEVPISVTSVTDRALRIDFMPATDLYLAWNISVAAGSSPNLAMGLAIDNVSISATFANEEDLCIVYAEDVTRWNKLLLDYGEGAVEPSGTTVINGVSYKYFELPSSDNNIDLTFTDGGSKSVSAGSITATGEHYFCVTATEATPIDDPNNYTGWVDPTRPPFVSSGIYLRGEVNSWGAPSDWEFSDEGGGTYVLYDKTLSGQFKVADANWSSACNYGSNGSSILIDTPYSLVLGTNDNISCGGNSYVCKRIVVTIANGQATLLLESDDDATGLTTVYVMGDNNGWNYMDTSGALELTDDDGVFAGQVTMLAGDNGMSHWRIYQRLGMGGVWGNPGGVDATGNNVSGTLEKGSTGTVSTEPGTYQVTFDINTGAYSLEQVASVAVSMDVEPADVVVVTTIPDEVKVLSLNNSLIYYNDQDAMFNDMAAAMGKNAYWLKHTLLGKPLSTHWEEGDGLAEDGTPGAKMLVRSDAWSHIILQEQSSLPRTNFEAFRANVKQWVGYIREYCPNPNAVIILPINWAYSGDWGNYTDFNKAFVANYLALARELGLTLCPVGVAYEDVYEREGSTVTLTWFEDDRHPTPKATYMAAAMEYGLIFGEDPATITWNPTSVSQTEAAKMRDYASRALLGFDNVVDHNVGTVRYAITLRDQFGMAIGSENPIVTTLDGGGSIDADYVFTSDGTLGDYTLDVNCGDFAKQALIHVVAPVTEVEQLPYIEINEDSMTFTENFDGMGTEATATLPTGWRIDRTLTAPRTVGQFRMASENTMYAGGVNLPSNAKNGTWNFGADDESDRAVGGISTGVADATRCVNVYAHLLNTGRKNIQDIALSYDVEKYRMGANAAGFDVQLYYSIDGRNWTSAGNDFKTHFAPDASTAGYASVPGQVVNVAGTLPTVAQAGCDLYLAWNISVASGDAAQAAMALAIDNVSFSGSLPPIPTALHYVYAQDLTGWPALGLYAWGDSELFGAWPGESWVEEVEVNGIVYKKFLFDTETGNFSLIFNNWNNGKQLPDVAATGGRDYYFVIDENSAVEVDPEEYTGVQRVVDGAQISLNGGVVTAQGTITAYDLMGRRVASANGSLDVSAMPHGIYIIHTASGTLKIAR